MFAALRVLSELGAHSRLGDALLELALKVLELEVAALKALGEGRGGDKALLRQPGYQSLFGGHKENPLLCLLRRANLQLVYQELHAPVLMLSSDLRYQHTSIFDDFTTKRV